MPSFKIVLTEEDVDYLTYEYNCVERTVERILQQAKEQGYINPEKRINETVTEVKTQFTKVKKLTKKYIEARIIDFEKNFMRYDIKDIKIKTMQNTLNEIFRKNFGAGQVNQTMFSFNNHDCAICPSYIKKSLYIEFNTRRKKILNPKQKEEIHKKYQHIDKNMQKVVGLFNEFELEHSHNVPFVDFCCQHCNLWIITELEKLIFDFL